MDRWSASTRHHPQLLCMSPLRPTDPIVNHNKLIHSDTARGCPNNCTTLPIWKIQRQSLLHLPDRLLCGLQRLKGRRSQTSDQRCIRWAPACTVTNKLSTSVLQYYDREMTGKLDLKSYVLIPICNSKWRENVVPLCIYSNVHLSVIEG
jgi:hypothetical protein